MRKKYNYISQYRFLISLHFIRKKKSTWRKERNLKKLDHLGTIFKSRRDTVSLLKTSWNPKCQENLRILSNKVSNEIIIILWKFLIETKLLKLEWAILTTWDISIKKEGQSPRVNLLKVQLLGNHDTLTIFRNLDQRVIIIMQVVWTGNAIWRIWLLQGYREEKEFWWNRSNYRKEQGWTKS